VAMEFSKRRMIRAAAEAAEKNDATTYIRY